MRPPYLDPGEAPLWKVIVEDKDKEADTLTDFYFYTEEEAKAFVEGVEYVNDSQLHILGCKLQRTDAEEGTSGK